MAELNTADIEHVDIIDKEFRESLRKYNIKFEGRGKHIKKAQDDIISNLNLINLVELILCLRSLSFRELLILNILKQKV